MHSLLKPGFVPTDNPMFPVEHGMFADPFAFASPGTCFGPLAGALPFISAGLAVIGTGMSVLGQMEAGNVAARNAAAKQQQMNMQAQQQEQQALQHRAAANMEAAQGQRQAIEQIRKGRIMASRAQAVMASAGAGIDDTLTAGLLAEGDYAGDVAIFEGDERARVQRNAGTVANYNADALRHGGEVAVWQGEQAQSASRTAAFGTAFGGLARAGMSFASRYGGEYAGGSRLPADLDRTVRGELW